MLAQVQVFVVLDAISTDDSAIVHDDLSGFVANEHIDHQGLMLLQVLV